MPVADRSFHVQGGTIARVRIDELGIGAEPVQCFRRETIVHDKLAGRVGIWAAFEPHGDARAAPRRILERVEHPSWPKRISGKQDRLRAVHRLDHLLF